ncbi:uncharacterized protein LOC113521748 [Galleria mellonella]|uniref:Uncharacterized protein LOC113521748 n=1 Tax=Galleria mellonella TaxID=7137 RepID=A0A6J1X279_GALME|nr:uncharacterized protein LOC113521748 [Galleria mellonella]
MLPSMPILYTRESQDAFGNKIEPSTSFFNQNSVSKPVIYPEPQPQRPEKTIKETSDVSQKETKGKGNTKKKQEPPKIDDRALENALVTSYYNKVKSKFSSNSAVAANKFFQFQNLLQTFDPSKETPVQLYRKVEMLFGEDHKDLVEEFLMFLKPGQAAEVGRFMDHFTLVQMTSFIELLQITFSRKPTVLRKILRAITTGINSGRSEDMKARVLPHLRSNPRLTQMFKALFADERPPDSIYENGTDTINESFLTRDKGYDFWEFDDESHNKRKLDDKESLDTMYLHGRVFLQHGRLLRTARVTYPYSKEPYRVHARRLAPPHCHLSPPESDEERASPKRTSKSTSKIPPKKTKKQLKSPTKNVKDVNDNTKVKETVPSVLSSPKTVKGKSQSNAKKNCKDRKESDKQDTVPKKDKKENKNQTFFRKEEATKIKQTKAEPIPGSTEKKTTEVKNSSWTRDEDKTMLEVLKGEASSELVFCKISELLPHRSVTEIKERFCHVMNLLQQMQMGVGEVT